jgi:hypothetical protein
MELGIGRRSKPMDNNENRYVSVSKHDATRAEYGRFGGVGIMARQSESSAGSAT